MSLEKPDGDKQGVEATFEVLPVKKPIFSVSALVKQGFKVHFAQEGSYLEKGQTRIPLTAKNGVFVVPADMDKDLGLPMPEAALAS